MAPRRNDRSGADLIRKMESVKEDLTKHRNEMEVSMNGFSTERLDGIEQVLKNVDDNVKTMSDDTEALLGMLETAVNRAKQSIADEANRMEKVIMDAVQPMSTNTTDKSPVVVNRRMTPKRKARGRVRFEVESDDGEEEDDDDNDDDEDYVVGDK